MKHCLILLSCLFLFACANETVIEKTSGPMVGDESDRVRVGGYEDMCKREPESKLCKGE